MAQAGSAHDSSWIPSKLAEIVAKPKLSGHARLLSTPAYRHILEAEPILRRSIPVLIVTFIVVLALTRVVGVIETRQGLENAARDEATLIAATLSARYGHPTADPAKVAWGTTLETALAETLPPRATAEGRQILVADGEGQIVAAVPTAPALDKRPLADVLGPAQPLTTFGARAGVMDLTLADGRQVYATVHHVDQGIGSVAVLFDQSALFSEWRANLRANVTLFVFTAVILLVLTYAYFVQALRANAADELYSTTTARTETAFKRGRCGFWDWDLARGRFYWSASMFEMLGIETGDGLLGFGEIRRLVHRDDIDFEALADQLLTGEIDTLDRAFRLRRADGTWLWFRVRAEVVDRAETGSRRLIGIAADITEHRRLVETTLAADLRLNDAIETISEAFVLWDAENRLVMCNSKYRQLHGLPIAAARPGTPYSDVMRDARQPLVRTPTHSEGESEDGSRSFEAQIEDGR
jgi:two-component system cell cycle sensor histidine kinase PleC